MRELREKELEFQTFNVELKDLRRKIEDRDKEINDTLHSTNEKEKQRFVKDRNEKEDLQRKIEEMVINYRDLQLQYKNYYDSTDKELHNIKRDYYIIQEEKKILVRRLSETQQELDYLRTEYAKKAESSDYNEQALSSLQEKYRELCYKDAENNRAKQNLESIIKAKTDELDIQTRTFSEKIQMLKKKSGYNEISEEYEKKLQQVNQRKDYYKDKVNV